MASRQNLSGRGYRGGRGGGYGYGPLAGAYGGPANLVNPKMEEWRAQQKSSKGIERGSAARNRIARAQQTGVGRGTQEQIVRHTTPGGGGYNRAEAMARERQLASRPEAEQIAMLGRKANPKAGLPGGENFDSSIKPAVEPGAGQTVESKWTPEARKRWQQDQKDLQNPFGPRMRKDESGQWSAEQKQAWRKGETPRQQLAGITGGQAGLDRAFARMKANTGRERTAQAAETPWDVETREAAEAEAAKAKAMGEARAAKMSAAGARSGPMRQAGGGRGSIWGRAFSGSKLGGRGGFMSQAMERMKAKRETAGGAPKRTTIGGTAFKGGGGRRGQRRTGGIGGASKTGGSIRSRGLRGRGIGGSF